VTVLSIQWPQPGGEDLGLSEEFQICLKAKLAILKSLLERIDKFAARVAPLDNQREKRILLLVAKG
jgi:hypothetical protein